MRKYVDIIAFLLLDICRLHIAGMGKRRVMVAVTVLVRPEASSTRSASRQTAFVWVASEGSHLQRPQNTRAMNSSDTTIIMTKAVLVNQAIR